MLNESPSNICHVSLESSKIIFDGAIQNDADGDEMPRERGPRDLLQIPLSKGGKGVVCLLVELCCQISRRDVYLIVSKYSGYLYIYNIYIFILMYIHKVVPHQLRWVPKSTHRGTENHCGCIRVVQKLISISVLLRNIRLLYVVEYNCAMFIGVFKHCSSCWLF